MLDGSVVDHLASQGALQLDRGLLYAVNAGSDTITVFAVDGDRLIRRQVLPSGGSFPVSVAVHGNPRLSSQHPCRCSWRRCSSGAQR